ncbi:MAG TPA: hypothetical protein VF188_02755 [Longimicrobiales bacterium]
MSNGNGNGRKLGVSDWLTIGAAIAQILTTVAVVNWRMGAVERRLDTLDARLWELRGRGAVAAVAPDATRVALRESLP